MVLGAIGGFAAGMGLGVGYGVLSEYAKYGLLWAKWKAMKGIGTQKIAEVMQALLNAEKDEVTGLSTKGQVDTIVEFIDKTLDFAGIVDESIATQMFVQMIQQSIAYAIHSSHAGSIGTVGNVYSGSTYLSAAESTTLGSYVDFTDRKLKGFLSAEVGQNIPTLAYNLMRGANTRLEEMYRTIIRDMDSLLSEWNDLALSYYRQYHTMARSRLSNAVEMKETATERAYSLLEQVGNEHLSRISEQLDTIEGAKAWWDANLMTDDELKDLAIRVNLERAASEANYDEYKTDIIGAITSAIATWDAKITQALGDLTDNETKYSLLVKNILNVLFTDVSQFAEALVNMADVAIEDVCAYRNVNKAVGMDIVTELGITEPFLPVEVEILYWQSWIDVPPITVKEHYESPRGKAWESV